MMLVHCQDDPWVPFEPSINFTEIARSNGLPVSNALFPSSWKGEHHPFKFAELYDTASRFLDEQHLSIRTFAADEEEIFDSQIDNEYFNLTSRLSCMTNEDGMQPIATFQ